MKTVPRAFLLCLGRAEEPGWSAGVSPVDKGRRAGWVLSPMRLADYRIQSYNNEQAQRQTKTKADGRDNGNARSLSYPQNALRNGAYRTVRGYWRNH